MSIRPGLLLRFKGAGVFSAKILMPTVVVVAVVVAAASVKGWAILPFMHSPGATHDPNDWCRGHGVPESLCIVCHPELKEKLLWCNEHGLPEALCTLCHPELAEGLVMCQQHNLPEALCTLCNSPGSKSSEAPDACTDCEFCNPSGSKSGAAPDACAENCTSESACTECAADLPVVKLASAQTAADTGIEVVPVQRRALSRKITRNAVAIYDQNHLAQVRPRVEGIVREVRVDVGAKVQCGDVLAVIDSVRLGAAKAAYFSAVALLDLAEQNFDRLGNLADKQIVPGKTRIEAATRLTEARVTLSQARQQLLNLGVAPTQIDKFAETNDTSSLLPITAPLNGVVVRRQAVAGEAVEATTEELFAVADLATMWVHLDIYESDLRWVRQQQPVQFVVPSLPDCDFRGHVTWINPEVNALTRTIQVRAEIDNSDGSLRAGMYGSGVIEIEAPSETQVVPKTAVQWYAGEAVVFVKKAADLFEPRRVRVGRKEGPFWEIATGVKLDELVVTTGSFLLKTELMKGSIGAGCCGD